MSNIVGEGWHYMPGSKRMHYFIETDERPQIVTCLCGSYSTAPGIAARLLGEGTRRVSDFDCKACRTKLDKRNNSSPAPTA